MGSLQRVSGQPKGGMNSSSTEEEIDRWPTPCLRVRQRKVTSARAGPWSESPSNRPHSEGAAAKSHKVDDSAHFGPSNNNASCLKGDNIEGASRSRKWLTVGLILWTVGGLVWIGGIERLRNLATPKFPEVLNAEKEIPSFYNKFNHGTRVNPAVSVFNAMAARARAAQTLSSDEVGFERKGTEAFSPVDWERLWAVAGAPGELKEVVSEESTVEELIRVMEAANPNVPKSTMMPMVRGLFRTSLPIFYSTDRDSRPMDYYLTLLGFANAPRDPEKKEEAINGHLIAPRFHFVAALPAELGPVNPRSYGKTDAEVRKIMALARYLGLSGTANEDTQQPYSAWEATVMEEVRKLGTSTDELLEFHVYLRLLEHAASCLSADSDVAVILLDGVSPANSVFWDTDFDEHVRLADRELGGRDKWSVINLSYHYPLREKFAAVHLDWRRQAPHSRFHPILPKSKSLTIDSSFSPSLDTAEVRAAFWTRRGIRKFLTAFRRDDGLASRQQRESPSRVIYACGRPIGFTSREMGCRVDYWIAVLLSADQPEAFLVQPPLFSYRPFDAADFSEGRVLDLTEGRSLAKQQAIVEAAQWANENAELFESLHGYLRLAPDEKSQVLDEAVETEWIRRLRHNLTVGIAQADRLEEKILVRNSTAESALLASRFFTRFPINDWFARPL